MPVTFHCHAKTVCNPGQAFIAWWYKLDKKKPVEFMEYIGDFSLDYAYHKAVQRGLESLALTYDGPIDLSASSMVVLNQIYGMWSPRNTTEFNLCRESRYFVGKFEEVRLLWVDETINMANEVMKKTPYETVMLPVGTIKRDYPQGYIALPKQIE